MHRLGSLLDTAQHLDHEWRCAFAHALVLSGDDMLRALTHTSDETIVREDWRDDDGPF